MKPQTYLPLFVSFLVVPILKSPKFCFSPQSNIHTTATIIIASDTMFALRRAIVGTAAPPAAAARRRAFASSTPSGGKNPWLNDKSVSAWWRSRVACACVLALLLALPPPDLFTPHSLPKIHSSTR